MLIAKEGDPSDAIPEAALSFLVSFFKLKPNAITARKPTRCWLCAWTAANTLAERRGHTDLRSWCRVINCCTAHRIYTGTSKYEKLLPTKVYQTLPSFHNSGTVTGCCMHTLTNMAPVSLCYSSVHLHSHTPLAEV